MTSCADPNSAAYHLVVPPRLVRGNIVHDSCIARNVSFTHPSHFPATLIQRELLRSGLFVEAWKITKVVDIKLLPAAPGSLIPYKLSIEGSSLLIVSLLDNQ